jgi:ABC-type multidrug transport system fused ATPase/permease subunit
MLCAVPVTTSRVICLVLFRHHPYFEFSHRTWAVCHISLFFQEQWRILLIFDPVRLPPFILGSSGSGKSTIAQLLLGMYQPQHRIVLMEDTDLEYLDHG